MAVEYSHEAPHHECLLTQALWESHVGPHDLFRVHGTVNGRRVRVLVDDGSTHNFLNYTLVKKLGLPQARSSHTYMVSLMNGEDKDVWDTEVKDVALEIQGHSMVLDFHVMHMTRADVVLEHEWLHGLVPSLKHSYHHNKLTFDAHGAHVAEQKMEHPNASIWFHSHTLGIHKHAKREPLSSHSKPGSDKTQTHNGGVGTKAPTITHILSILEENSSLVHGEYQYNGRQATQLLTHNPI